MRLQSNRSSASLSSGKEVVLSPLHSMLGSHWSSLLQLFFIRGRALIQGVHHEHHVWPRWDSGMARPHDLKAQEAECLQEWSYQREGDLLLPGIILFTSPLSHQIKVRGTPPVSASRGSYAEKHSSLQQGFCLLCSLQLLLSVKGF